MKFFSFTVHGKAATAGSKRAFPFKRRDGSLGVAVSDDAGEKGKTWRSTIVQAYRDELTHRRLRGEDGFFASHGTPIRLRLVFGMKRPKSHYNAHGEVKDSAPGWPAMRPDVLKLARAVEDALTGVLWADDAQIVQENISKKWVNNHQPWLLIEVEDVTE